jgi:hypothetical protein
MVKHYSESDTNTYSASSLTPGTQYFVKVYVKDTNGYSSPVYDLIVKTNYTNPVVNSVTTSNITQTSITVNVNTTKGTNNIATYYYSSDNGVTYTSSASNTYTFTGLTQGTTYNIKVYVKDSLSYQSNIYSVSATTLKPKFYETILANNGGSSAIAAKGTPNFANVATTDEGMYAAPDDYGTSYYFRGAVSNNWVKFAGIYWRIVRINGNNTVKLVYSGTTAPTEAQKVVMTGTGTQIGTICI